MPENLDRVLNLTQAQEVPAMWRLTTLGQVATLQRGNDLPVGQRDGGQVPVIGSNGVVGFHSESIAKGPGVLVGRSGSVGSASWIETDYWPLNTALWVKDFHGNDPRFVYYLLSSLKLSRIATGVSVPTLNRNLVHPLRVAVPTLPEQRAIAHVLRTVQWAKEATEKTIAAAKQLKGSLMWHLFRYGPVAIGDVDSVAARETAFGPVPSEWRITPLSECADVQTGVAKGRSISLGDGVEVPYLRVANVQDGYLDLVEMKQITIRRAEINRFLLKDGDVVLTEGGDFDKLGRGFVWKSEVPGCVHQNHIFAVRAHQDILTPEFLAYLTQSPYGKSYFLSVAHKTTNLACINTTKLKALPVPIPTKWVQAHVVNALQSIDARLRVETRRLAAQLVLFDSLLHNLMTGKVRVHNLQFADAAGSA